ncbi:hypothetical protein WME89_04785 [Sorangium sp. So ce321]|uniref:hypothetical protein n=1 Tax=Sorangium sp. So ce321 TaxID=3133300 RepID=UPI003F5F9FCE
MHSLFVALATAAILVLGASRASADVQNVPELCEQGIGATGFETGRSAQHAIVMRLWSVEFRADFHRANQFIDNVTRTVLAAQPPVTVEDNAFLGCRFIGMVDGATRAIVEIATNQLIACAKEGVDMGTHLAQLNCALTQMFKGEVSAQRVCYVTIDIECRVDIDLGCRTGFDRYVRDHGSSACFKLTRSPELATFIKDAGCNLL